MANPKLRSYQNFQLSSAATTVIKAGEGTLHGLFSGIGVNDQPINCRVWLYDNATTATGTCILGLEITNSQYVFDQEVDFVNGLSLKVTPLTSSAGSLTVVYS